MQAFKMIDLLWSPMAMRRIVSILLAGIVCVGASRWLQSCSVAGYALGDGIDEKLARPKPVGLNADSCECQRGDRIQIVLVSDSTMTGVVRQIVKGEYILLATGVPGAGPHVETKIDGIGWQSIVTITRLDEGSTWKTILTAVGLVVDLTLLAFMQAMKAMSAVGA